jgi:imidazole glycerol-phosphate synthase subunit HisH
VLFLLVKRWFLKIGIIDTGTCNVRSILNAFDKINAEAGIVKSDEHFSDYDGFVLSVVGAWDYALESLHSRDLWNCVINCALVDKEPLLGICLGMQLLTDSSEEGRLERLGLIPGKVLNMRPCNEDLFSVPDVTFC